MYRCGDEDVASLGQLPQLTLGVRAAVHHDRARRSVSLCGCMAELTAPTLQIGNTFAFLRNNGGVRRTS